MANRRASSKLLIDLTSRKNFLRSKNNYMETITYFEKQKVFVDKLRKDIKQKFINPMLRDLREEPTPRSYPEDYPIEYVSAKQARLMGALLNGKPYRKTHGIQKGWVSRVYVREDSIRFRISNKAVYSKYVIGLLGLGKSSRSIKRYTEHIQPFHTKTGWKPAYETFQKWADKAIEYAKEEADKWIQEGLFGEL